VAFSLNSGSKAGKGGSITPVINVTPLVDVVLVLLIIFMVIIPNMQEGKTIEMLRVQVADEVKTDEEPLTITISLEEVFTLEEQDLARADVLRSLRASYAENTRRKILLRGDTRLPYRVVREFFREVQEIGFANVALAVGVNREWSEEEDG
jgi:biopolymer transport protein TolR